MSRDEERARLFVAVDPTPDVRAHLGELLAGLAVSRKSRPGNSTGVTDPARWHITVVFLGQVKLSRVAAVTEALSTAAESASDPIRLRVAGGGRFGRGRFTVLWAGIGGDVTALKMLATGVRHELRRRRLPFDEKPLRPHLTLARPGDRLGPAELAADLAMLSTYEGPEWAPDELRLIRSELGPKPVYTTIASAALG